MSTLESLKNLVAVIVGEKSTDNIPGTTVAEVIDYLATNYPKKVNCKE